MKRIGYALLLVTVGALPLRGANGDSSELATMKKEHPRILVQADTWEKLRAQRGSDPLLDELLSVLRQNAETILTQPVVQRKQTGKRLLRVSRDTLSRVLTLGTVYKLGGGGKYLQRALVEMEAAAEFADWNPSHFLDTAEMCTALAIGYDWFYEEMTPEQRVKIRGALVEKAFKPGLAGDYFWKKNHNNWNAVCWGGLTIGALALAEDEPDWAERILAQAKENIVYGMKSYAPEGVYPEGPMYWSYGTTYLVLMMASLETALGTDWGLGDAPGFKESAEWLVRETSYSGKLFNFFDAREEALLNPALYWFARRYQNDGVLLGQRALLQKMLDGFKQSPLAIEDEMDKSDPKNVKAEVQRFLPLTVIWWKSTGQVTPRFSKDAYGRGENPVVIFRSAWNDPRELFLGLKGGAAILAHGHMDAGSFVFDVNGQRWAMDLGMQEYYSLESKGVNIWDGERGRWTVYRINNFSHNTLTINGQLHVRDGVARIVNFSAEEGKQSVTVDLSPVFKGQAASVQREFFVIGKQGIRIVDKLDGLKAGDKVEWRMMTPTQAELSGEGGILLKQNGEALELRYVIVGGEVQAAVQPAVPPNDYDEPNPGVNMLTLTVTVGTTGKLSIENTLMAK